MTLMRNANPSGMPANGCFQLRCYRDICWYCSFRYPWSSKKYLELYSIYLPRESQFSGQRRNCREPSRSSLSASSLYHPQSMPCCAPGRLCRHKKITSVHYSWLKRKGDRQREKEKKRRGNQSGGSVSSGPFPLSR